MTFSPEQIEQMRADYLAQNPKVDPEDLDLFSVSTAALDGNGETEFVLRVPDKTEISQIYDSRKIFERSGFAMLSESEKICANLLVFPSKEVLAKHCKKRPLLAGKLIDEITKVAEGSLDTRAKKL